MKRALRRIVDRVLRYAEFRASEMATVQLLFDKLGAVANKEAVERVERRLTEIAANLSIEAQRLTLNEDRAAAGKLCALAAAVEEAAGEDPAERQVAGYYRGCADWVARRSFERRDYPASISPEDDLSESFSRRSGIYIEGNEAVVGHRSSTFPVFELLSDPACGVFLCLGQSNAANHGTEPHQPRDDVFCLNFHDMRVYSARDPLPGASGSGGSVWSRLGDLLLESSSFGRVLFIPVAFGGTFVENWVPGGEMNRRLALAMGRLRALYGPGPLPITAVLWQQGEAEANHTQMTAGTYCGHIRQLVDNLRHHGVFAPVFVAKATVCEAGEHPYDNRAEIRRGQELSVDPTLGILPGPDADLIGAAERYDGCHFSADGLRHCARMWADTLARFQPILLKSPRPIR